MTDEAGAITGELEMHTRVMPDGGIEAMVRYAGGQDHSTLSGSPVRGVSERPDQEEYHAAHERVLESLTTPNRAESGNQIPVGLLED
jgi:hypothetical protein